MLLALKHKEKVGKKLFANLYSEFIRFVDNFRM